MSKRFRVGQEVVRARRGGYKADVTVEFETLTITKVGTRYAYAKRKGSTFEERFDGKTGKGNTFRSNEINEICETREAFETAQRELQTRQQFARAMNRWTMFDSNQVPVENITQAAELLGLKLDEW